MSSRMRFLLGSLLCVCLVLGRTTELQGATQSRATTPSKGAPGWEAAKTISMLTGVAISPLLGVGAVGAYTYYKAAKDLRPKLHWYAQPWFFIPALLLVGIVGLKDVFGTAAPTALKKPFDIAEAIENKISGLVAAGAFIPLIISVFPEAPGAGGYLDSAGIGLAAISAGSIGNLLLTPLALVAFAFVWLSSHAVNMLILLSPFTIVDSALKAARLLLLSLLTGAAFANPYLGAALGLIIIVVSYFIAGWSFRLTVFGTIYIWDYITFRRTRFQPGAENNKMFTARKIEGTPVRTYGRLVHQPGGHLRFEYRPWLFLQQRSFTLPKARYIVGRGLFCPELDRIDQTTTPQGNQERITPVFILPPRYLTHEEGLARAYAFSEVRDIGILKGFQAMWNWLKSLVSGRKPEAALVAATKT